MPCIPRYTFETTKSGGPAAGGVSVAGEIVTGPHADKEMMITTRKRIRSFIVLLDKWGWLCYAGMR
jgi:hypothetical protein